jgi:peptidoglycan/LPS O-acetylase OafA/YrhL
MRLAREQVRHIGAICAGAMAGIYLLIGLGILDVGSSTSGETVDFAVFGFSAGAAFLLLALFLTFTDRRLVWVLASLGLVWVYVIYFAVSGGRQPSFELWGLTLRILQLPLLVALVYLSWKPTRQTAVDATGSRAPVR